MLNKINMLSTEKIGLMGGTFDPIHIGHLIIAENARLYGGLDKIIFIPSGNPPHKEYTTPVFHRMNMVKQAVEGNRYFQVSDYEITQSEYSYTINTFNHFKKDYDPYFIGGADNLSYINEWKNADMLLKSCKFIIATRGGLDLTTAELSAKKYSEHYGTDITVIEIPNIDISSTCIRERIRNGKSIKYLVPEPVEKYIIDNNLYTDK